MAKRPKARRKATAAKRPRGRATRATPPAQATSDPPSEGAVGAVSLYLRTSKTWIDLDTLTSFTTVEGGPRVRSFESAALRWSYRVRARARWAGDSSSDREIQDGAIDLLRALRPGRRAPGVATFDDILTLLAEAGMIEVNIEFDANDESRGWAHRILPWEFILASATERLRRAQEFVVLRRLDVRGTGAASAYVPEGNLAYVESVPAALRRDFDFAGERALIRGTSKLKGLEYKEVIDPTATDLPSRLKALRPRVVHVAGCDVHQGRELLGDAFAAPDAGAEPETEPDGPAIDGYLMYSPATPGWTTLRGMELATALVDAKAPPSLVCFNIYNSGARLAALCVSRGAGAAIGFQDSFDDRLAELFFSAFYRAGQATHGDWAAAFDYAWSVLREQNRPLLGSGLVLWSRVSIASSAPKTLADVRKSLATEIESESRSLTSIQIAPRLVVDVKPCDNLNYSILHNRGALFERFSVRKDTPVQPAGQPPPAAIGAVDNIVVTAELHVGTETYPFRTRIALGAHEATKDLAQAIQISLASTLGRSVRESVRTNLYVNVVWEAPDRVFVLHQHTYQITLLPVDEWRDDDLNRRWLPSFVLPRDPAVRRIVDSAQRYLMALEDDPGAGFDGYQSVEEPAVDPPAHCRAVDLQAQAIWAALLYEHPLSYINPPPTFTEQSQRLRTPSDTLDGRRGTCIDLALLYAACLEYVEIYPAIILLRAHAFPAYWRHSAYWEEFRRAGGPSDGAANGAETASRADAGATQRTGWSLGRPHFREIMRAVRAGRLVPLETVMLTQRTGFAAAVDSGLENFTGPRDFDSMLDVMLARGDPFRSVTPLPLRRDAP